MGWWSATILGGDTPMDYVGDMKDIANINDYDYDKEEDILLAPNVVKDRVNKAIRKLVKYCDNSHDIDIAYQVLGVVIMTSGAKLSDQLRTFIISAARNDEWAKRDTSVDKERKTYINRFVRQLQRYPSEGGRPRTIAQEGLFEKMSEHFKAGTGGLINKNV